MGTNKSKINMLVLALCLMLTIMLFGCGSRGGAPAGDDSTPVVTATPDITAEPPKAEPDNTPYAPKEPIVLLPDPPNINEDYLDCINEGITISDLGEDTVLDNVIDEIYKEYDQYLNENISKNCIKLGLYEIKSISDDTTAITPESLDKVNDYLIAQGEEPLGTTDAKQRITALWIAASLYYDPDYYDKDPYLDEDDMSWRHDIAMAFALAKYPIPSEIKSYADIYMSEPHKDIKSYRDIYASGYASLFNLWEH